VSGYAVRCCGCAEWSPVMSTVGGDVWLRVRAVCVAGAAGSRGLRRGHAEDHHVQVQERARGRQACKRAVRTCGGWGVDTVDINNSAVSSLHAQHPHIHNTCHSQ
jgi:hypothetical protein